MRNAPQIAAAVEHQVALGELAVGSSERHQRAQRACRGILPNDAIAERPPLRGRPKEIAVAIESDSALRVNAVCGNSVAVEANQRGQRAAAEGILPHGAAAGVRGRRVSAALRRRAIQISLSVIEHICEWIAAVRVAIKIEQRGQLTGRRIVLEKGPKAIGTTLIRCAVVAGAVGRHSSLDVFAVVDVEKDRVGHRAA